MDDQAPADIAVDSCKGYIYWTHTNTDGKIEKVKFDGSDRKVMSLPLSHYNPFSLAIDPQTQKMFYFDVCKQCKWSGYLNRANLNGTNETILLSGFYGSQSLSKVLTVSKDYIYWMNSSGTHDSIWQLPKKEANNRIEPKEISKVHNERILGIVAKYKIEDQIKEIQDCVSLSSLIPTIHLVGGSELCDVPVCTNYCLQGNCSVNDEGHPECSCNAGYTGGRCEVSACNGFCLNDGVCSLNGSEPACQCKGDYLGDRCEITKCLNYCIEGNCSLNSDGLPKCSCNAGYTGGRCEVSACNGFCLNDGACSLNGNSEPVCQCKGDYLGDRCEITKCLNYCIEGNCSLNSDGLPKCSCNAGYSGERCEVSVCHSFCLNYGECSLNEEDEPVCQCVGNYVGARCEADTRCESNTSDTTPTYDVTKRNLTLADILSIWRKPSSKMYLIVEV